MSEFEPHVIGVNTFIRRHPDDFSGIVGKLHLNVRNGISKLGEHWNSSTGRSHPSRAFSWEYLSEELIEKVQESQNRPDGYSALDGRRYINRTKLVYEAKAGEIGW